MFEQTFTITETLRWLSAAIAFVGVFSALMALQFERTRQLGIFAGHRHHFRATHCVDYR